MLALYEYVFIMSVCVPISQNVNISTTPYDILHRVSKNAYLFHMAVVSTIVYRFL